jgi:hypothetical protein
MKKTKEGLTLDVVNALVDSHLGQDSETLLAAGVVAEVGVLADVSSEMLVEVVLLSVRFLAILALMGFLMEEERELEEMSSSLELRALQPSTRKFLASTGKSHETHRSRVCQHVPRQSVSAVQRSLADLADKHRSLRTVSLHVVSKNFLMFELLVAESAWEGLEGRASEASNLLEGMTNLTRSAEWTTL